MQWLKRLLTVWRVRFSRFRKMRWSTLWLTIIGAVSIAMFLWLCFFVMEHPQWMPHGCYPTRGGFCR